MFSSTGTGTGTTPADQFGQRPDADRVFGDVFEDVCPPSQLNPRDHRLTISTLATPARGRAPSPCVGLARRNMRRWSRLHHGQRTWSCCGCMCGKQTRCHQRCQGKVCGRRLRRLRRGAEGRGVLNFECGANVDPLICSIDRYYAPSQ